MGAGVEVASQPGMASHDEDPNRWRALLAESSPDPLLLMNSGILTWVAGTIERVLGWTSAELADRPLAEFVNEADLPRLADLLRRLENGDPNRDVLRMRRKDGREAWVLVTLAGHPPTLAAGDVVGSFREIDRRVRAEQRLNLIAEHTSDILFTADEDGRITWVSPAVTRLLDWPPDDLIGSQAIDLVRREKREPRDHEGDRPSPRLFDPDVRDVIVRVRERSGTYRWMRCNTAHTFAEDGQPNGVIGSLVDTDDLVRARDTITENATRLQAILDTLLDPHALLRPMRDADGTITDFTCEEINAAGEDMLGMPRGGVVGRRLTELLPGVKAGLLDTLRSAMGSGEPLILDAVPYRNPFEPTISRRADIRGIRVEETLSVIWRDVTERQSHLDAIAASEEKYRLLAENATDVVVWHRDLITSWVSPSIVEALGWTPEAWLDRNVCDFVHMDDIAHLLEEQASVDAGNARISRLRMCDKNLDYHWVEVHARPYFDAHGDVDGAVFSFRVVDREVQSEQELHHRAEHDELTGLLNRNEILGHLGAVTRAQRQPGRETAILFCDLDRFKEINDTYGHSAGDTVLHVTADRIRRSLRSGDPAARFGGDEFVAVLDGVHATSDALQVAEKVRAAVAQPVPFGSVTLSTSVSIGVALMIPGESADALIARADAAMYEAKRTGRNRVTAITTATSQSA